MQTQMWRHPPRPWLWLAVAAALLAAAGNVIGLAAVDRIYGNSYPSLTDQTIAQDLVDLIVVAPAIVLLAVLGLRGSLRAYLTWLGTLVFTVYNYVIYTFTIRFGPLFLLWVAVLGLCMFALVGGVAAVAGSGWLAPLDPAAVRARYGPGGSRLAGWFLMVLAAAFAVLWLADIVPALLSGAEPAAVEELGAPTNPVHVLDLAFFLPAVFAVGLLLVRGRPLGYALGPASLLFLALTGLPILVTPFVADARDHDATWTVMVPIGVVTVASLAIFARTLRAVRPQ